MESGIFIGEVYRKADCTAIDHELELLAVARKKLSDLFEQTCVCEACSYPDCGKLESLRKLGLLAEPG